ncbi:hypothetical protein BP00DRAFT_483565 [Aspergillus indologenus CBS 114.80]|uniref:Protein kinase domain-containing protein n=1 Tax=Aspergillus indologenus CBS 114.80 TaxID=1450541 RepID=A0A2V5IJS7_9EURO|nr:hypothetical protein BP00DRAFT_483565 [Aspergillus indologenus CBS 114.80]
MMRSATLVRRARNFEEAKYQSPSPRKVVESHRTIYTFRSHRLPKGMLWGQPVICDLDRADIRGLGVMVWDIFKDRDLFNALNEDEDYSPSHHVAEMVGCLGLPPVSFVRRCLETRNDFTDEGNWLGAGGVSVPATFLQGFIRLMLQWIPEKRKVAQELLNDPWLNSGS